MTPILLNLPNQLSFESNVAQTLSLLERCTNMMELKQIHAHIYKTGLIIDPIPVSRLLTFSTSLDFGNLIYARKVFDRISRRNTFMWNTMIRGYSNSNEPKEALFLYHQMLCHSTPHNAYTFPFLLKACSRMSALEETQQIHAHIIKTGFGLDIYATNSLLHVYAISGSIKSAHLLFDRLPHQDIEALKLFHEMQVASIKPDNVALVSSLSACAHLGSLDEGRWIHTYIDKNGIKIDPILGCVLIDMYVKCGDMDEALKVFRKLEKRSISAWTAIINGFAIHGQGQEALDWFMKMQKAGIKPNSITFTAILTACSHAGLVDEGKLLFKTMMTDYKLNPTIEHYGCMVDLLGRAGLLLEAKELIEKMPLNPNPAILGALLNACRIHGHLELGKQIGKILIEVDPAHGGRYIHLASIHAADGEWDQAVQVRSRMKNQGVSKLPGCSAISLNGIIHEFLAGDASHPQMDEIYKMWNQIAEKLQQDGYKPATGDLLLDLDDEEKERAIQQHSEKLAIAFGLIRTKPETTIRIFKNLRVCEDCHTVLKLISKIYAREIIVRDRTRFHLFKEGKCSCRDYW
ncbi:hypothetical protein RGQ29_022111 [Quercus rubra]|uniref:DYW domain-containing protein n=1 Tax=Quercus rubra TaxID=3512 RepID=A0AAN7F218_QUERU|nr:hypothetical protein RGQ29_022111 [Quercus rubra]